MAGSHLTSRERARVDEMFQAATGPAFEQMMPHGILNGITTDTAREQFQAIMLAAVELQAGRVKPTDAAFGEFGGPPPDTLRRFMNRVDLGQLPGTQMRAAVEAEIVPAPETMLIESRTEAVTGPTKMGSIHLQPPPEARRFANARKGAENTRGGIATALAVADCGGVLLPVVELPLFQGHWNPVNYKPSVRRQAERALRDRAGFHGECFTCEPVEVARELVGALSQMRFCKPLAEEFSAILTGGRLRMGFPRSLPGDFGLGDRDAYIGSDLSALDELRRAGLAGLFELPMALRGTGTARCDWTFDVRGTTCTLMELEGMVDDADTPWVEVPEDVLAAADDPTLTALTLRALATSGTTTTEVELIYLYDSRGRTDLFVTTLLGSGASEAETRRCVVDLAVSERLRRRPGSPTNTALRSIYDDGFLLRHQRRNYADRRSFGGVVQAAYGVLQLARAA